MEVERNFAASRDRSRRKIKYQENDTPPEEIKRKIVLSDLRNPPKQFYAAVWRGRKI